MKYPGIWGDLPGFYLPAQLADLIKEINALPETARKLNGAF